MIRTDIQSLRKGYRRGKFYLTHFIKYYLPSALFRCKFRRQIKRLNAKDAEYANKRVNYYVRIPNGAMLDESTAVAVRDFRYPWGKKHKFSGYFFDLFELVRCGDPNQKFNYLFGDIDYEASIPTFVKSRPVTEGDTHSALVKLDSVRHFAFLHDDTPYEDKRDMLVFRNIVRNQPWRTKFLELYHDHPLCDAGQVNNDKYVTNPAFVKDFMSINQQLGYKFICCIEGHDVATNLKWVMSSNSIAVMPKPRIESWFMEGSLIGGVHYIEVRADYSDIADKLRYYIDHPDEAKTIIANAHEYCRQFLNKRRELMIGRMVAMKYLNTVNK